MQLTMPQVTCSHALLQCAWLQDPWGVPQDVDAFQGRNHKEHQDCSREMNKVPLMSWRFTMTQELALRPPNELRPFGTKSSSIVISVICVICLSAGPLHRKVKQETHRDIILFYKTTFVTVRVD